MTREDILEKHYGKARGEVALVWALAPVAVAIFVIVFAAGIGRPRGEGGMFFALLCAAPLLLLRDNRLGGNVVLGYLAGIVLSGAAGYLSTGDIGTTVITALLGAASVWVFHRKKNGDSKPKLNKLGQQRLNDDLRAAGHQEEAF